MAKGSTDKVVLYMHAGSGNHGCEALANTLVRQMRSPVILVSTNPEEDKKYSLYGMCTIQAENNERKKFFRHLYTYVKERITKDPLTIYRYRLAEVLGSELRRVNVSIGGDNYCYDLLLRDLMSSNRLFNEQGAKTVLLGCSIEPETVKRPDILEDLNRYALIGARESITYQALVDAGLGHKSCLVPDSAFNLPIRRTELVKGFIPGRMVGVNISPMVTGKETKRGITMDNYRALIRHILDTTDMNVALIPHVIWKTNDDRTPLAQLFVEFEKTGRVVMVPDDRCDVLKDYISQCRFFVGARTHSTIAAYSTGVPTLVVGYSVKARGIARDLLGTEENYVLPVQELKENDDLVNAFTWIAAHEDEIRDRLTSVMPAYQKRAALAGALVERVMYLPEFTDPQAFVDRMLAEGEE